MLDKTDATLLEPAAPPKSNRSRELLSLKDKFASLRSEAMGLIRILDQAIELAEDEKLEVFLQDHGLANVRVKLADIARVVGKHYRVSLPDLQSPRRAAFYTLPRHVVCYLAKTLTSRSYPEIGSFLGDRDHTTVLHAYNKISDRVASSPSFAAEMEVLARACRGQK